MIYGPLFLKMNVNHMQDKHQEVFKFLKKRHYGYLFRSTYTLYLLNMDLHSDIIRRYEVNVFHFALIRHKLEIHVVVERPYFYENIGRANNLITPCIVIQQQ